ncbi:hypothetical protein A0H81_08249 [Grifola frondosa]|uniref:Uncharacterized protein n=1 Tax=Grifola frondosa TaxID=5627 RepID=A0A1C7M681_GRIFR|nr:hypothetical protein A0H81_08249 [Grifola frondosa]
MCVTRLRLRTSSTSAVPLRWPHQRRSRRERRGQRPPAVQEAHRRIGDRRLVQAELAQPREVREERGERLRGDRYRALEQLGGGAESCTKRGGWPMGRWRSEVLERAECRRRKAGVCRCGEELVQVCRAYVSGVEVREGDGSCGVGFWHEFMLVVERHGHGERSELGEAFQ